MSRWWWLVAVVMSGCGSTSRPDSGQYPQGCESWGPPPIPVGCECGTVNVTRCDYTETANCGACGAGFTCSGNTCHAPPWDGGMSGSLVGRDSFTPAAVTSAQQTIDVGTGRTRRFQVFFFDQPVSGCGTPTPPFSLTEVRIELRDGGVVARGTYPLDGISWVRSPDGGIGVTGSVTISRIDTMSSAGDFTTTLSLNDGGSSALTGTWEAALCP